MRVFECSPALAMVAARAAGDQVFPGVAASQPTWDHVVKGWAGGTFTAVLAGVIISPKHLLAGKFYDWTRPFDHVTKPDDRWAWVRLPHGSNFPAAIQHHGGFIVQDQTDGTANITHMDRFKICVEHQHRSGKDGFHG